MRSVSSFARLLVLAQLLLLSLAFSLGCRPSGGGPAPDGSASAALAAKPHPTSVAQAETLKQGGASWTNEEIRVYYNQVVSTIGPSNEQWKRDGLSAEARAHKAFEIRHDARLTCRAMMASAAEVDDLRKRDQEKYGSPDGPTFEKLVESGKQKGATGDAVYEGIIASAQRTDDKVNAAFGIHRTP
jgi:hypothetical protein